MATKIRRDWTNLDPLIDNLKPQGWNDTQIAKDLGLGRQTLVDHLRSRGAIGTPTEHLGTPEHQGTLEGHQEVMEEVHQSVPDAPHIGTEDVYQSMPEHPSTPGHESLTLRCSHRTLWCTGSSGSAHEYTDGTPRHTNG